jgi:hypothetical protein
MGRRIYDLPKYYRDRQLEPDLLYTIGGILLQEYDLGLVAHLDNANAKRQSGTSKPPIPPKPIRIARSRT